MFKKKQKKCPPGHEVRLILTEDGYKEIYAPIEPSDEIGRLRKFVRSSGPGDVFEYDPSILNIMHSDVLSSIYARDVARMGEISLNVMRPGRRTILTDITE